MNPAPRRNWAILLGLGLAVTAAGALQLHFDFEHDDAYISYRYAENWAQGRGLVFNPGERVEGYSNFAWVVILGFCRRLGLGVVTSARVLGAAAGLALVVLVFDFVSRRLARGPALGMVAAMAIAVHAAVAVWAPSGLETLPHAVAVLAALGATAGTRGGGLVSGLLFGVVALFRIDGFVYFLATTLFEALRRRGARSLARMLLGFLLVFAPFYGWRLAYYGYWWPNSYYLKTGGDVFQQIRGIFYTHNFIQPFGGPLLFALPLLLFAFRDPRRDPVRAYLGFVVAFTAVYIIWAGGDHMPMSRFFVPLVAPITVLLLETASELRARLGVVVGRRLVPGVLFTGIVFSGFLPAVNPRRMPINHAYSHRTHTRQWAMAGRWFASHSEPGSVLATEPAGAVSYYSGLRIIDMLGVNDLHIAHLKVSEMGHGGAGHEKRDFDYVLSRRPELIFRGVRPERRNPQPPTTYSDGSTFEQCSEALGRGPVADDFGVVSEADLFVWFERRLGPGNATRNRESRR